MMVSRKKPLDLGHRIHLIDGFDLGVPERTGTYVLKEEKLTLIETSGSASIPYVLEGLNDLHIKPEEVEYVIVTHIHLDHAGGAGLLLEKCPNAKLVVHPKGARHMVDPSRLIQGARAVYGKDFDKLYAPVRPVPEEKIITKDDNETLQIGENCTLTFYDTPGHANHHFCIYDPVSNGIFTGDTIGIQQPQIEEFGLQLFLPATSPNQFNPDKMIQSMERIKSLGVERIYFGHYGMTENVEAVYEQLNDWLPVYVNTVREVFNEGQGVEEASTRVLAKIRERLNEHRVPEDHRIYDILKMDLNVFTMGIIEYLQKKERSGG